MNHETAVLRGTDSRARIGSALSRNALGLLVVSITLFLATGCAGVRSSSLAKTFDASYWENSKGVSYFLPTNSVRVVFTNETIASEINKAKQALKEAEDAVSKKNEEITKLEASKKGVADKPDELKKIEADIETRRSALKGLEAKVAEARTAVKTASDRSPQILVEELPPVPDTSKAFTANLDHSMFSDDTVTLKTSADGLLTSVDYRGDDQTGVVVQNLVKTAIETGKLYARLQGIPIGGPSAATGDLETNAVVESMFESRCPPIPRYVDPESSIGRASKELPVPSYYFENTFSPADREELSRANLSLLMAPVPYLIDIRLPKNHDETSATASIPDKKTAFGLLYRRSVPYDIVVYEDADSKDEMCRAIEKIAASEKPKELDRLLAAYRFRMRTVRSAQMAMPAGGAVAWLDLSARPFVETHITAEFAAGQLTSVTTSRPSEGVGLTEIPLNAVTEVGNAVGEIIDNVLPLQLKYTNDKTALLKAQAELLKEQQAYQDLLDAIRDGTYVPDDGGEGDQPESGPGTTPSTGTSN